MVRETRDEAFLKATGRDKKRWFVLLDKAGALEWEHRDIARWLVDRHKLAPWWSQHVTGAYERARGRRVRHELPTGFAAGITRTLPVAMAPVFAAWTDAKRRARWLPGVALKLTTINDAKNIRAALADARLDIRFVAAAPGKTRVTVDVMQLASAKDVARAKADWAEALERLKALLLAP